MNGDKGAWIIPGQLLAISFPDESDYARFQAAGVACLINLTSVSHDSGHLSRAELVQRQIPVPDFTAPSPDQIDTAIAEIDERVRAGQAVAIHCHAGLGRTGTICACYLVRTGLSADGAMARVRGLRPGSIETAAQGDAVRAYARRLDRAS